MGEGQVSVEGLSKPLDPLFFVIATQNPVEFHGTYPLPEAQMDRFAMRFSLGYVTKAEEISILACLQQSVLQRIPLLSAAVCVLLDFDEPRRNMIKSLEAIGLPLRILLIAEETEARLELAGWKGTRPDLVRPQFLTADLARL
jgi:Mg-chelatase subunit ChlI